MPEDIILSLLISVGVGEIIILHAWWPSCGDFINNYRCFGGQVNGMTENSCMMSSTDDDNDDSSAHVGSPNPALGEYCMNSRDSWSLAPSSASCIIGHASAQISAFGLDLVNQINTRWPVLLFSKLH